MADSILRIDAPAKVRRFDNAFADGGLTSLAGFAGLLTLSGLVSLVIAVLGSVTIGLVISVVWIAWWLYAGVWAIKTRREARRWRVPLEIGVQRVHDAHTQYWRLTPETRSAYGKPLVESLYRLTLTEVRGGHAVGRVVTAMYARVNALKMLVDAEDKMRLYAIDPELGDNDDLAAAEAFQQAVEAAQQQLRHDDLLR